nr:MAG TPA: hypothetical protein [Caudoviricetes sp.]DAH37619.1 MAG TPA: hypothetical protein [Caudoviricetes sp.]
MVGPINVLGTSTLIVLGYCVEGEFITIGLAFLVSS